MASPPAHSRTPPRAALTPASPRLSPGQGLSKAIDLEDDYLFNSPPELVCPLTLAPFLDPVLTTAGHVYERSAIQAHLEHSTTDPLTRQPLLNKSLTPVYVLRSRALEYREGVAKACIQRICSGAPEPMRYLRRAVDLVADTCIHVQGLSSDTVEYVLSHSSNAFDRLALQMFAQGLFQAGYRDKAAAIYGSLLLEDADRVQQAELLRRCLSCWTEGADASSADEYVFSKLVALFEGRPGALGWDQLAELAQHAQLGDAFVLRLCEQLLFRTLPSAGGADDAHSPGAAASTQEKRLLLRYVHVLTDSVQRRQTETERRLAELERWRRQHRGGGGSGGRRRSSAASSEDGSSSGGGGRVLQVPGWLRRPVLLAPCMVLVAALPPEHAAARVLRALPLLALLPHAPV
ncbi:hypothetical protein ABPG75_010761 [Micractinium tetrahymenae]